MLQLLPLLLLLLLAEQQQQRGAAAMTGNNEEQWVTEEKQEQSIPFLAEEWDLTSKLGQPHLSYRPSSPHVDKEESNSSKDQKSKHKSLIHSMKEPPRAVLQLHRGESTLTDKEVEKEKRQRRLRLLHRENNAVETRKKEVQKLFADDVDIAERDAQIFYPSKIRTLLKYAIYFLSNGGKLPEEGFLNDI